MERNNHVTMLYMIVLSAVLVIPSALAATHTVGDNTGWDTPTGGNPYATWASQHTFVVGDVLVFNFATGSHTVANVTRSAFDGCNTGNPLSIQTNGPASFTINTVGSHYFICTILNHCSLNQKLTINATTNNNGNNNSPSPTTSPNAPSPFSPRAARTPRSSVGAPTMAAEILSLMFIFIGLLVY